MQLLVENNFEWKPSWQNMYICGQLLPISQTKNVNGSANIKKF